MAANTDKFKKGARRFSTTLSGSISISDATIGLTSVTGLPTDTAIEITIDRVDSLGELTPTSEEIITGVVSGSNLITCLRGVEGTAQAHVAGATVEIRLTANQYNDGVDGILVEHNQDGTHNIINLIYPIGAIYMSVASTTPDVLFGGTWTSFGEGRTLVGIDSGDTDFDDVEEEGGEKNHTLITGELPIHNHGVSDPGHPHTINVAPVVVSSGTGATVVGFGTGSSLHATSATTGVTTTDTGSGTEHNNLQPYIVTYMWKRVS